LNTQVAVSQATGGLRLTLSGNLPPDDLAAEAARLLRTRLFLAADRDEAAPPPGELVRTYARNTKDKGVFDHATGQRSLKIKQVLDGDLQPFLDERLRQRSATKGDDGRSTTDD
jgi:hypothetical protein